MYLRVILRLLLFGSAGAALLPELLQSVFQLSLLLPHLPQSLSMLSVHRLQLVLQLQLLRRQLPQPGCLAPTHCLQLLHTHAHRDKRQTMYSKGWGFVVDELGVIKLNWNILLSALAFTFTGHYNKASFFSQEHKIADTQLVHLPGSIPISSELPI